MTPLLSVTMWLAVGLSLWGYWLVVQRRRAGFLWWIAANVLWIAADLAIGAWPQALLFLAYTYLSVHGYVAWKPPRAPGARPPGAVPNLC